MARKPLHPLVNHALLVGLTVGARAAARAVDSLLKDAAVGLGQATERVKKTRRKIKKKVRASGVSLDDDREDTDVGNEEEEE